MDSKLLVVTATLFAALPTALPAQVVYRCEQADGTTVFSDLPCESDIGERDTVDATPHQGHRPANQAGGRGQAKPASKPAGARRAPADDDDGPALPRHRRLALERERKALLSDLKRRHVPEQERRRKIDALMQVDEALGIGAADLGEMPFHDRDVYEDNGIYR